MMKDTKRLEELPREKRPLFSFVREFYSKTEQKLRQLLLRLVNFLATVGQAKEGRGPPALCIPNQGDHVLFTDCPPSPGKSKPLWASLNSALTFDLNWLSC